MYKCILVPMALDHNISPKALRVAKALSDTDGTIIALHVYDLPTGTATAELSDSHIDEGLQRARALLHEKLADAPEAKPVIVRGHTYRTIVDMAKQHDVDCIVMGSHKPGFSEFLLGSTAARVVRHADCDVHVCRGE